MEWEFWSGLMGTDTKANLSMGKLKERAHITIKMEEITQGAGLMDKEMVLEEKKTMMDTTIKETG